MRPVSLPCRLAALALLWSVAAAAGEPPRWIGPPPPPASPDPPRWVWAASGPAPGAERAGLPAGAALATDFEAPEGAAQATLLVAADNHAVAFLNGAEVLRADDWRSPARARVVLKPGRNRLAIRAENEGGAPTPTNPAAVIAVLEVERPGTAPFRVVTDGGWRAAPEPWPGFPGGAPPEGTSPAVVLGPFSAAPWGLKAAAFSISRPCPLLRRAFTVEGRARRATVRVIGLGHYQLRCNGRTVGDTLINQAWSQYDKTLYWQEFDLAPLLVPGENTLGILLGNSFWVVEPAGRGRYTKTDAMPDFSGGRPHLLWLDATIETDRGTVSLTSDERWKWSPGPLSFSNVYAGEDYDARLWPEGWDAPGFDDSAWKPVEVAPAPPAALAALPGPGIKAFEVFRATETREPAPNICTYVFPQNCSALLRFTLEGPRGATVRFKPCEYMDPSGRVAFTYTWGTRGEIWQDYTLRGGGGAESHQTLFCYLGAQYVQVEGAVPEGRPNPAGLPVLKSLELVHTRAACPEVGRFTCSSDLQNVAHRLIDWSIRSNMSHFPTDCPHREKNSWLEEDWHMARALSYRYDTRAWMTKLCRDIRDTQLPDGHIPTNSPNYLIGVPPHGFWNEAPEWGIAGVLVPWHLYEWYGDRAVLEASFGSMKRYVDYLASQAEDGVITSNLGDWYDYGHGKGNGPSQWTPAPVSATAIWAIGADTLSRGAGVLGRSEEEAKYRGMYERVRADFQRHFYDAATKTVKNNGSCQAAHAAALCAGLIPEADRAAVLRAIVDDLERRHWQQTVGEVLQVFFVRALAEGGRGDALHRVYAREERGGYGFMVRSGLTTLPESWSAEPGTSDSMNHFMLGHLMEWHFAYVAGIRQRPGSVGWRHILVAPSPSPATGVTSAAAAFDSPAGRVVSRWAISGATFSLHVAIPEGSDGLAVLPDGSEHPLSAGEHDLNCPAGR